MILKVYDICNVNGGCNEFNMLYKMTPVHENMGGIRELCMDYVSLQNVCGLFTLNIRGCFPALCPVKRFESITMMSHEHLTLC